MKRFLSRYSPGLILVGILCIALAGWCGYYLPETLWKRKAIGAGLQEWTLAELVVNGSTDKAFVSVKEFTTGDDYVMEWQVQEGNNAPKQNEFGNGRAWLPLLEKSTVQIAEELKLKPQRFSVLLETTTNSGSASWFKLIASRQSIEGFVVPLQQHDLPIDAIAMLKSKYPATDLEKCLVLIEAPRNLKSDVESNFLIQSIGIGVGVLIGLPCLILGMYYNASPRKPK
jgi:hypothetical protein